jgi:hypothetical protein
MRTRLKDFLNTETMQPAYSFQYLRGDAGWAYPPRADQTVMTWPSTVTRDKARACFTTRKTPDRALADLQALRLISTTT